MCLIVAKPKGSKLPGAKQVKQWFRIHEDGFGIAFDDGAGNIRILKGAMTEKEAARMIDTMREIIRPLQPEDVNIIYHFRQATEGTVCPANCHPFPITQDVDLLGSTDVITDIAIAHNGMIFDYSTYSKGKWMFDTSTRKTDTQLFIEDILSGLGDTIFNDAVKLLIAKHTNSKFAMLSHRGIDYIGAFIEDGGLFYSNGSYLPPKLMPVPVYLPSRPLVNYDDFTYEDTEYYQTNTICEGCGDYYNDSEIIDTGEYFLCKTCYAIHIDEVMNS